MFKSWYTKNKLEPKKIERETKSYAIHTILTFSVLMSRRITV